MKILQINTGIFPVPPPKGGGTELHIYELSQILAGFGHQIDLVSDVQETRNFNIDIRVKKVHSLKPSLNAGFIGWMLTHFFGGLLSFWAALNVIMHNKYDIIHLHSRINGLLICLYNKLFRKKLHLIYTLHNTGPWLGQYDSKFEEFIQKISFIFFDLFICHNVNQIIVVGDSLRNELIGRWRIDDEIIVTIHNGIHSDEYSENIKDIFEAKNKYNIKGEYILFVGQLHKRKGVNYLIRAMEGIDHLCVIVGDGPEKESLKDLAYKKLKLSNIVFTGAVLRDDLISLYAGAKLFVLPSTAEALPLTILEAMASGLPILASNVGSIPEIIVDNINGHLFEPGNVSALQSRIQQFLHEPDYLIRMGSCNRKYIRENFDWENVTKKILDVYINIAGCN